MSEVAALSHLIHGAPASITTEDRIDVTDPASGEVFATIPGGGAEAAASAVEAACTAFASWSLMTVHERGEYLVAGMEAMLADIDEIADLEVREVGHVRSLARAWIEGSIRGVDSVVEAAPGILRTEVPEGFVAREPLGPAAIIVPWNFPIAIALRSLPHVLVAGNTVILKPSERAPVALHHLAAALASALPAGVLSVLHGDARSGRPLVADPRVRLIVHTGSTASGRDIAAVSGPLMRRVVLELGGKDPVIVDADVDPRWAAEILVEGALLNTGQICTSMERIYVHEDIADEVVEHVCAIVAGYVVGPGDDPATMMGPLIDERQRRIVQRHVDDAVAKGAELRAGGSVPDGPGFYYPPTVLTGVDHTMDVMVEETFGPIIPIQRVASFDEAMRLAADTPYGLAATVLTRKPEHQAAAATLPAGVVWINEWHTSCPGDRHEPRGASGMGPVGDTSGVLEAVTSPKLVRMAQAPERHSD